uniref:Putative synaptic vesicle transporter svop n=1 Tax=Ornithodoros turicata TaxID=34597 RepID=A0A2R5LJP7_9ACAR
MLDIVNVIGGFGTYHVVVIALAVTRAFPTAWTNMLTPLIAPDIDHWCARPAGFLNLSVEHWKEMAIPKLQGDSYAKCEMFSVSFVNDSWFVDKDVTVPCGRWEYNTSTHKNTIVEQWDLVCKNDWHRSAMQSIVMAGSLVGGLLFGDLSDRFGRRRVFFTCATIVFVFGSLAALSPGIGWFNAARFFLAMGIAGCQATAVSLLMEIMPPGYRMMMNVGFGIGYTIPLLLLPLLAYTLDSWNYLQLGAGLFALLLLPYWFIIQESPRWLMTKGRLEEAEAALVRILRINRKPVPAMEQIMTELVLHSTNIPRESAFRFLDFFSTPRLRRNTLVLFSLWTLGSLVYYNIVLASTAVPGNPYVNYALSAFAEIPAALVGLYIARRWPRRKSQCTALFLAGLAAIPRPFLPRGSPIWLNISSHMLIRFFILSSGFIKWIMVLEVFPTTARSFGFACCLTCSRFGGMVAPFLKDLGDVTQYWVPHMFVAASCFFMAGTTLLLPETLNKPLPDTFYEADKMDRKKAPKPAKNMPV